MSSNMAFESGDDRTSHVTKRGATAGATSDADGSRSPPAYTPDEGTFLAGPQTYFAEEKIAIPTIEKVS